ncbi:MAG: DUF11 domain-containing protein [Caldilineaceae bacterium]
MNLYIPTKLSLRYVKIACGLLLLMLGTFVTVENDASGQTLPQIVIKKVVQSVTDDSTKFTFRPSSSLGGGSFSLRDGDTQDFHFVPAGSGYFVKEDSSSNWILASATCDNGNDPTKNIVVELGKTVTCTFTNQKKGKLVIRKTTVPASDTTTDFAFTAGGGLSPQQFSLEGGDSSTYDKLAPGAGYSVVEAPLAGWEQTSATCDNGSPVTNITIGPGATVTCTFVNTKLGALTVRKITNPNPDPTNRTFAFVAGGGLTPATFLLKNGETQSFPNLSPRAGYTLSELTLDDWELSDATCSDGSPITNIKVDPGETITCTFTNKNTAVGLTLTKRADAEVAIPGQLLTYQLSYKNGGPLPASTVVLTEQIPDYTTYVGPADGPNGWTCTPNQEAGATCVHPVGTVAVGDNGRVDFVVQLDPTVPAGVTEIKNRATIGAALLAEVDVATAKTALQAAPDLQLSKTDGGSPVAPGGALVYGLTYQNSGNQAATGVVLTDTLPDYTTFDADNSSNGWHCNKTTCRLAIGTVAAGVDATANFAVQVASSLPADVTAIVNVATIADDGDNGADPTPENNQATVTTPLNRTFVILATKRDSLLTDADSDGVPSPGDTLEYAITIRSNSNAVARNVIFRDTPDPNTELLPGVESTQGVVAVGNSAADGRVEVALGDLAGNGATVTIRFRVQIASILPPAVSAVQNQGSVSSTDFADVKTDDPDTGATNDATRTALRAFAQLEATLVDYLFVDSDGNEVVSVGDILIYRLTLHNTGNGAAGDIQIIDHPNLGLELINGSVSSTLGDVVQGNRTGDLTMRVDIPVLPANDSVLVSYQARIAVGAEDVVQNQAEISAQTGLSNGPGSVATDDPDIAGEADVTVTPLGSSLAKLQMSFLPFIGK